MTFVFDATPLIYLGKAERLDVLDTLQRDRLVPQRVYEEVVGDGLEQGYADAKRVETYARGDGLEQRPVEETPRFERLVNDTELSSADTAVLLLADEIGGTAVVDEQYGRDIADAEGIQTRGTAYLLLSRVKHGTLGADDAREILEAMLDAGWHCSPSIYAKILRKLDALASE